MKTPTKLITALALAGIAVAGGAAFTGVGLVNAPTVTQFIGGSVEQAITGAQLISVNYTHNTTVPLVTEITAVDFTFTPDTTLIGKKVHVAWTGGTENTPWTVGTIAQSGSEGSYLYTAQVTGSQKGYATKLTITVDNA